MSEVAIVGLQRDLLERLAALCEQQALALERGDIASLARLSELRGDVVGAAAPYAPPGTPWAPELAGMAARVRERCEEVQRSVHARLAAVRRDLARLDDQARAARRPPDAPPSADSREGPDGIGRTNLPDGSGAFDPRRMADQGH